VSDKVKRAVVEGLELLDAALDWVPTVRRTDDGWRIRTSQLGCLLGIGDYGVRLDEKWQTGVWRYGER
jgi:hypothetical protein